MTAAERMIKQQQAAAAAPEMEINTEMEMGMETMPVLETAAAQARAADRNPAVIIRKITADTDRAGDGTMENK